VSEVVTGEAVALELRLAKLPSRVVAGFLDVALQLAVLYAVLILGALLLRRVDSGLAAALSLVVVVAVFVGYPVTMETLTRGRTLGKMAMGIRVVRDDGGPIGFRQALVRGLFAGLIEKPGLLLFFTAPIGILVMLVSSKGKRLGDVAAGTMVLQERMPAPRAGFFVQMPLPLAGWAATMDLSRVDDGLALSVRQFLSRTQALDAHAAAGLGQRLTAAVGAVTTPAPPPGTPDWAYLSAVLAERRRRQEMRMAARPDLNGPPSRAPVLHPQPAEQYPPAGAYAPVGDASGAYAPPGRALAEPAASWQPSGAVPADGPFTAPG